MTDLEVRAMLTFIARFDNREVTDDLVDAWAPLFADTATADAKAAIQKHYASTRAWVMPADILGHVKTMRARRLEEFTRAGRSIDLLVEADPADALAWQAERYQIHRLILAGDVTAETPPAQIQAAVRPVRQLTAGAS